MSMMITDTLRTQVAGQASRRGLIMRVPSGDSLLESVEAWLLAEYGDAVRSVTRRPVEGGDAELSVALHPGAPNLMISASDTGRVAVTGETVAMGPGYHRFVGRLVQRLGVDLSISWDRADADGRTTDDPETTFADRATTEHGYLGWLGQTLVGARANRAAGRPGLQVGIPGTTDYTFDGAIGTVLGPRDDSWLESAVADTRIATDITPWWADASDGRYLLNRALTLMWLDVRWRAPAIKEERALLDEIHRILTRAYPMDPNLPYPWRAWAEIIELRGIEDPMSRQVVARAERDGADAPPIGYRRAPVTIRHEGWRLQVPGSYAERRSSDEWWGGSAGRSITLAAVETATDEGAMGAQTFVDMFGSDLGPDAIDHRANGVIGRARLTTDTSSGVEVAVLDGYSAVVGSGAAIRIVFDDPEDWQWALDMWRSLAPG
ncbi:MAG TPA: hypothetical protein VF119_04650 [Candidatus Limnocylindrales bacterium]